MVKKIIFALSLLTAGAPYAAAQSQGITINVTSADDGEPVEVQPSLYKTARWEV